MKKILILSFVLFFSFIAFSQEHKVTKGDEKYEKYAYIDAIKIYEAVIKKGYSDPEMLKKLGNSYYFNADFQNAEKWYAMIFNDTITIEPEYYYRYAQCLKSKGEYELANKFLDKFSKENTNDSRGNKYQKTTSYLDEIKSYSNRFIIEDAGINTEYPDYGGFLNKNEFIYTAAKDEKRVSKTNHTWTNQAFSNLYTATIGDNGALSNSKPFSKNINTKFHESSAVITKDGNTLYFTRNNYIKRKKGTNSNDVILLKLYKAELINEQWDNISELPFNSNEYNTAHPALSADEKTLYFASDMPGTKGLSDLFKVTINADGIFGTPENLGETVNTEGKETFPFISQNNELYFSSNGHLGLGGLDIFTVKINDDGSYSKVYNIGAPINSTNDDFAFLIDDSTKTGYFSSNREGGKGYDDIYKFKENILLPFKTTQTIEVSIMDEETSDLISNALVSLLDANMNQRAETMADGNLKYQFKSLESSSIYYLKIRSNDYEPIEVPVLTEKGNGKTFIKTTLARKIKKIIKGEDLAKTFSIKEIYFGLNKWDIRKDAEKDLIKIVEALKQNPTMKIDIRSHTDSRETSKYNLKLSDKRAKSTMDWIIKQGINPNRLTGKGYGESQLINKCSDGVDCTEDEHQANRRSNFIVVEI